MFGRLLKKGISLALSLSLILGMMGEASVFQRRREKKGYEVLSKWYEDYRIHGNSESDFIVDVDGIARNAATRYLGSAFWVIVHRNGSSIDTKSVSVGYRAYIKVSGIRKNGFVTCGHALDLSVDDKVYTNSFGTIQFGAIKQTVHNSTCDAAFVIVNSGTTISNKTHGFGGGKVTITPEVVTVEETDKVSMCGAASGVKTDIMVVSTSAEEQFDNDKFITRDLIYTYHMATYGDSGAPVYKKVGNKYKLVGIVKGITEFGGGTYVVKAKKINTILGTTPY